MSCVNALENPARAAGRAAEPDRRRRPTTPGPISPTCCTSTTSPGATTCSRAPQPDCDDDGMVCKPVRQSADTPGIWNPLPWFDTSSEDHQLRNIQPIATSSTRRSAGRSPSVTWLVPNNRVSEHPPALSPRPDLRHRRDQRDHAQPGLALDRDLPRLGRLGRVLRPRHAADGRPERLRAPRAGARDLPVREAGLHRPPDR